MNYELTDDQAQTLAEDQPELMVNINIGINDMLNNCYYKRDGEASVSSRIVGGAPALPGTVIKWGAFSQWSFLPISSSCGMDTTTIRKTLSFLEYNSLKVNNLSNQDFIHGWYRCVYQGH